MAMKLLKKSTKKSKKVDDQLNEFTVEPSDGGDDDEYDLLVKLVKMWWLGDEHQHVKAEKTLASMGISIDEDDPDIILRRGTQFLTFPMDDFQQGVAEDDTHQIKGNELIEYLMKRFEMTREQAIELLKKKGLAEDWQKVNHHDKTDGMSGKAVKAYRRENPGSKLKTAVTTKPSKLKAGSKDANRRKSFCARMGGMKKHNASAKTKRDPDSPINKALRRWNCESIEQLQELMMIAEQKVTEAKNLKQQAAIAISKKEKAMKESVPNISDIYEQMIEETASAHQADMAMKLLKKSTKKSKKVDEKLNEFALPGGDDREPDEEEILKKLAAQWWLGTEQQMAKAQRTLASMGWEIGQDESGDDDAGVFVIRAGDVNGDSYMAFNHSDLELNEGAKKVDKSITENVQGNDDVQKIKDFIKWSIDTLNVKNKPKFTLSKNTNQAQKGHHTGVHSGNSIWVYIGNRNLIDIFRTIFHELVHQRQEELNMIKHGDSYPGSPIEALADMMAGKYIKIYGKEHPEIFQ